MLQCHHAAAATSHGSNQSHKLLPATKPRLAISHCPADLTGTVPATLARLQQLEQLDLEFNLLSGSLGQQHLCPSTNNSLQTLYLRANNFTGPLELGNCRQLQVVDIQVCWGCSKVGVYQLKQCQQAEQ